MFFKKGNKDEGVLKIVLDIRSSSVGAALLVQKPNSEPLIKYTLRKNIYFENRQKDFEFVDRVMLTLEQVLDKVTTTGLVKVTEKLESHKIDEVMCVFASPWYKSQIKNFKIKKNEPVKFTKKLLDNFIKQKREIEEINPGEIVVDNKILSVYMNGYENPDPFNKSAKDISVSFYTGLISEETLINVREKIKTKFNVKNIKFTTHPLVIISVIKNKYHSLKDFLLVDIGGEMTDLGLFRDSVLQNMVSVPHGVNYFVRQLQKDCSFDQNTAVSHLNLIYDDKLHEDCASKSKELVKRVEKEWLSAIKKGVSDTWTKEIIPPTIFVTVDNNANELAKNIFTSKAAYMKTLTINQEPIIHVLNNKNMKDLCDYDQGVSRDALLSVIAGYSALDE